MATTIYLPTMFIYSFDGDMQSNDAARRMRISEMDYLYIYIYLFISMHFWK
jgi:hypothetical protein